MDRLIPIINKLQDIFSTIGTEVNIDLPQIVVVGSQSSGKSSVLEALVGKDFLPRGSGIVTRRPLVLQLNNIKEELEWGEFLHKPNEKIYNFSGILQEIEIETNRISGTDRGISNTPINLKIYSHKVLNLTLVDLPGITRVPVGQQPQDIEKQIRNMIKNYITKPNTIILAITAANTDLSNSDAIQLAKEVDPEGDRTIGVITKIDIMDKGTDALDMLLGRVIPLKHGFVGVVNRSQLDIKNNKTIEEALQAEKEYFSSHELYSKISEKLGTRYLAETLNKILIQHINKCLPDLRGKITYMLNQKQAELISYGDELMNSKNGQLGKCLQIITEFCNQYKNAIDGKITTLNELYGGARIKYIFNESFIKCIDSINPEETLTDYEIRTAIGNATGPKIALFVPEEAFELLVRSQIEYLQGPCMQCIEIVYDELERIINKIDLKEYYRYMNLKSKLIEILNKVLNKYKNPSKEMIGNIIRMELAFINTNHPDFIGSEKAMIAVREKIKSKKEQQSIPTITTNSNVTGNTQKFFNTFFEEKAVGMKSNNNVINHDMVNMVNQNIGRFNIENIPLNLQPKVMPSDKEVFEMELIKHLIISYFGIVRKNIKDMVPKTIMYFLVNQSKENIRDELLRELYNEEIVEKILIETPDIKTKRDTCNKSIRVLSEALKVLDETNIRN
jgi:dynamin 1-like protein